MSRIILWYTPGECHALKLDMDNPEHRALYENNSHLFEQLKFIQSGAGYAYSPKSTLPHVYWRDLPESVIELNEKE